MRKYLILQLACSVRSGSAGKAEKRLLPSLNAGKDLANLTLEGVCAFQGFFV